MDIVDFINSLRESDEYIEHIYLQGGCYQFHLLLSKMYDGCVAFISKNKDHIITRYSNKFYDIRGEVKFSDYTILSNDERKMVEKWSFRKNNMIQLTECPNCDEPLTFKKD